MTIREAKEIDLVDYLSKLGHEPARIKGNAYWYKSPLRNERTPSFRVDRAKNTWYDFGDGRRGDLVAFGTAYHQCNISAFLQKLFSPTFERVNRERIAHPEVQAEKKIEILSAGAITSFILLRYLMDRRIDRSVSDRHLDEVRYKIGDKTFYALGFKNDSGGYELRNEKFKGSSSPKDSTLIDNQSGELTVFEGFFNYLSYRTLYDKQQTGSQNFLILNSTSFFEKKLPGMLSYEKVHLYLDNDKTGQYCTQKALDLDPQKFKDQRSLYQNYNDLNDWLINFGRSLKQQHRQKM